MIRRLCFAWVDHVFAVSHALRTYYTERLWIGENRIDVIPNGVDTDQFCPQEYLRLAARREFGATPDTLVIGTVGRLDRIKDHLTLFQAADLLLAARVAVRLVIVGEGPERKSLESFIQDRPSLAASTTFVGNSSDVVSHLNSFDAFVLPSLAEGMSNALLEAMSTGLACVATRVGGNVELVEDGSSGLLFEAGDSNALAAHLKALAFNPELRSNLGDNARRRVIDSFSLARMLSNYTRLYDDALGNRRSESTVPSYLPSVGVGRE